VGHGFGNQPKTTIENIANYRVGRTGHHPS